MNVVHEEIRNGFQIQIIEGDQDIPNPRLDWDHFSHFQMWHRNYQFGDDFKKEYDIFETVGRSKYFKDEEFADEYPNPFDDEFKEILAKCKDIVVLPVYMYDHSGITINTTGFSCGWDSGQIGWIWATKEEICKEYGCKILTKKIREKVEEVLRNEIKILDCWIRDEIYGYVVTDPNDEGNSESCWGFIGEMEYCLEEARQDADGMTLSPIEGSLP